MNSILRTGRDLTLDQLQLVVAELAGRPETWRRHVRHTRDRRHYIQLHRDPHLDVWLICWDAEQATGLHDHDLSAGAVHVVEGTLLEDYLLPSGASLTVHTTTHRAGSLFGFDASHIHDVRHDGGPPATSIHAYSPALWRMGHYALGERGLGRVSVSYMEELAA